MNFKVLYIRQIALGTAWEACSPSKIFLSAPIYMHDEVQRVYKRDIHVLTKAIYWLRLA